MSYEANEKRAKSNVLAALKYLGICGVLELLAQHCLNAGAKVAANPPVAEHYVRLNTILSNAAREFRAEVSRFDNLKLESKS